MAKDAEATEQASTTVRKTRATTRQEAKSSPDCAMCRHKHTPRSEELKKNVTQRINRVTGQLNGIRQMVNEDRYCGDVLMQLAAVENAVKAISREVMADHMETCVVEEIQAGNTEIVDEIMGLLRKFL